MKTFTLAAGLVFSAAIGMAHAATPAHEGGHDQQQRGAQPAAPAKYAAEGVLRAVKANKVQIAHEPVAELEWPAMTMWFVLQAPLPAQVRVGDKVRFEMEQTRSKEWAIHRIERKP